MSEDPAKQSFWDERYAAEKMPWDTNGVPERVQQYLKHAPPGRVLIPGCGSAYEVAAFHEAGWEVIAIDFSAVAVERAKRMLGKLGGLIILGDFFKHPLEGSSFDLVYERTFLCALPPTMWDSYAERMHKLLNPGGKLIGYFLYGEEPEPPPYPLTRQRASELFDRHFRLINDEEVLNSLPLYEGKERWQEWKHFGEE